MWYLPSGTHPIKIKFGRKLLLPATLEMMATGGVVVVAKNGGNQEYVKHRYNALVYNPGDLKQAATYIEELTSSKKTRETLIHGGLETAKKRNWDNYIDQIVELYN